MLNKESNVTIEGIQFKCRVGLRQTSHSQELEDTLEEQENLYLHLHNVAWSGFSMCEDETLEAIINS